MVKSDTKIRWLPNKDLSLALLVFFVLAMASIYYRWSVGSICWGVWLSEVVLVAATASIAVTRIVLDVLGVHKLSPEDRPPDYQEMERRFRGIPPALRLVKLYPTWLFIGFVLFCVFGFLSFYGLALSVFFPVAISQRTFSGFLSIFLLTVDLVAVLLPKYWLLLAGTLIMQRDTLLTGNPGSQLLLRLDQGDLVKMHFALLFLPPLALVLQRYFGSYHAAISIILIFVFYYPWERFFR